MLICIGAFLITCGFIFKHFPPKEINHIYGYRTKLSMTNQDTWNEANQFSAISLIFLGIVFVLIGTIFSMLIKGDSTIFQTILFLIGIALMIIIDEIHLRKIFTKDGIRKT